MKITLIKNWRDYMRGANLEVSRDIGKGLIKKGIAKAGHFATSREKILKVMKEAESKKVDKKDVKK